MEFVRFGGLSPVKQEHYKTGYDKSFHNPPRKKGNYAFPAQYVDVFLIGATSDPGHVSNKSQWLKDENGNKIKDSDFYIDSDEWFDEEIKNINPIYVKLLKKKKIKVKNIRNKKDEKSGIFYMVHLKKPKTFKYDGELWHHLGDHLKPHQIIETSGSWAKSDMKDYLYALKLEYHQCKKDMIKMMKEHTNIGSLINRNPLNFFTKDHLEVFIEKI